MALMLTLTLGASIANAGIIVSERNGIVVSERTSDSTCGETSLGQKFEDLLKGLATLVRTGIVVSERNSVCKTGIVVSE